MSIKRKILAEIIMIVLAAPACMIFNNDYEAIHYNIIGIAYAYLMVKIHRLIIPKWVMDYLRSK